ncbi:MAG: hypothetical protein LUE93_10250 [Bacteroides sp.]|nr:hypothetical protein [Bacteroides sp.]
MGEWEIFFIFNSYESLFSIPVGTTQGVVADIPSLPQPGNTKHLVAYLQIPGKK